MNDVRIPVALLAILVIAIGVWLFLWRPNSTPPPAPSQAVATTTESSQQTPQTTAPSLDPATVQQNISGTWQSTQDPSYSIVVDSTGKWTDLYKGSASSSISETGTYKLFTSTNPDKNFTDALVPGVVYIKVAEGTSVYYFSVLEASGQQLQISYLDRGNTLSFVKVK